MKAKRTGILLKPDSSRVLLRPFDLGREERVLRVIARILALAEAEAQNQLKQVERDFYARHRNVQQFFLRHFEQVCHLLPADQPLSEERKLLIGAYFTQEYALESAALFNPSMIWHPDQTGLPAGSRRFILSLRATGEGHISSITFRTGVIDPGNKITIDTPTRFVTPPEVISGHSSYEIVYTPAQQLSERVIFPHTSAEKNGIEDARFVEFHNQDGTAVYYATYVAFDGRVIRPQLLETVDFLKFKISALSGPAVQNKGFALFPRKIDGRYAMLSRQDNENIFLMFSDELSSWHDKKQVLQPEFPWEFVQLGNCGSPIETEAGWLVLSHGVGPVRKYSIGAFLLDRNDPLRLLGHLSEPLLSTEEDEREGYVPNVVYSCGGLIHGRELIIPYAMSDYCSSFATVDLDALLERLTSRAKGGFQASH